MQNRIHILAISASPRYGSTERHLEYLQKLLVEKDPLVNMEIICLRNYDIKPCLGCTVCYEKDESYCPHKDDLMKVVAKMREADGVVFASPTYVMNVSGLMKNFIDRLSYVCHRSEFFNKEAMLFTTCAGMIGSQQSLKSMRHAVSAWGFDISSQVGVVTGIYKPQKPNEQGAKKIISAAEKILRDINHKAYLKPNFLALVSFRYRQICYSKAIAEGNSSYDLLYWQNNNWIGNNFNYFIPIKINFVRKAIVFIVTLLVMNLT